VYSKKNAIYLTNDDTAPQLLGLSREVGTGGTAIQVLKESNGKFSIFGKEIVFDQSMPTLGDANDIVCVDLSKYLIGLWRNIEVKVSQHYKFAYDQTTFLVTVRLDGMCAYESAITPEKSSSKLSPIVGLAARA
jgi:HK97 family phage major capsid protein